MQEDIDQAIRRLEREIATCESSILSLSRSVSMVDASIQVEVQKAEMINGEIKLNKGYLMRK